LWATTFLVTCFARAVLDRKGPLPQTSVKGEYRLARATRRPRRHKENSLGKEIVLFSSEEKKELPAVVDFLRELADKLDRGQVILRKGTEELTLSLPHHVVLEVKAEEEDKKGRTQLSLEVEIAWYEGGEEGGGSLSLG
jgi:amphi-Trp domain-containing protein